MKSLFFYLLAIIIISTLSLCQTDQSSDMRLAVIRNIFQTRINQIDDDTTLRQAEVAVQNILNNILQRDCNACFQQFPRLLNHCRALGYKRKVTFLNYYRCR